MKRARSKTRVRTKEPLVVAAQTIGSTLGLVVAKIKGAGEMAATKGRTLTKGKRRNVSQKRRRKSKI